LSIVPRIPAQAFLLLAMLAVRRNEVLSREEVAFTLWPDLGESDARAALRRHLYNLQQAFPPSVHPLIVCAAKTVAWGPAEQTRVDVSDFERLSESEETFKHAIRLYTGDFAPYVDHEWATKIRERLRRRACRMLEQLIGRCYSGGDLEDALYYAEQLLAHDPWREDTLRQFMLLRYGLGDRAGALAYYRDFRERLRSEFDVDPMPQTVECLERIARGLSVDAVREVVSR
jgi:DNA-binding SARP family transcriptional activator